MAAETASGTPPPPELDEVVAAVRRSAKYAPLCEEFVRHVAGLELAAAPGLKAAIKATKRKLHQVGGAFTGTGQPDFEAWLTGLEAAHATGDAAAFAAACRGVLARHASTRERLPALDGFYRTILAGIEIQSVLDVGCGLGPLAVPWMPLAPGAAYYAYDVYEDLARFVGRFLGLTGLRGYARARDVTTFVPPERVDLALVLKTLPCLEQVDKEAGSRLLDGLQASRVLVSFPVRSLGGRERGMVANYERRLREIVAGRDWQVARFEFPSELAFLIHR